MQTNPIPKPTTSMKGKVCVVTGSTFGSIGWETAKQLAELGCVMHLPFRDASKAQESKQALVKAVPGAQITTYAGVNFEDLATVRKFAREFQGPLDVLVNNAGMARFEVVATKDNIESMFQVNHLAPLLLSVELVPALKQRTESRVVFVSSNMHYLGTVKIGGPYSAESRGMKNPSFDRYSDTKLLNVLAAKAFDRHFSKFGIRSNAVHPGYVISHLDQRFPWPLNELASGSRKLVARNTDEGAYTTVTIATDARLAKYGGAYFHDHCIADLCSTCLVCDKLNKYGMTPVSSATDEQLRDWVWNEADKLVGLGK